MPPMQTGRAIIFASVIVAAAGSVTAWMVQPRFTLANPGAGLTIRLDRRSGDMVGCERIYCRPILKGDKALDRWWEKVPDATVPSTS